MYLSHPFQIGENTTDSSSTNQGVAFERYRSQTVSVIRIEVSGFALATH